MNALTPWLKRAWCIPPERNATAGRMHWRFTTDDARIKLKHLYPVQKPAT
jgi:hypothetical protein